MRTAMFLVSISAVALPVFAQTEGDPFSALQEAVKPGQMVVVTDDAGRETTGTVFELSIPRSRFSWVNGRRRLWTAPLRDASSLRTRCTR